MQYTFSCNIHYTLLHLKYETANYEGCNNYENVKKQEFTQPQTYKQSTVSGSLKTLTTNVSSEVPIGKLKNFFPLFKQPIH